MLTNLYFPICFICLILLFPLQDVFAFDFWNDLRVKWDWNPSGNAFTRLPRNTIDAAAEGWVQQSYICTNNGRFNGFRWIFPSDSGVALLYDTEGNVAGIQTLVPQKDILKPETKYRFEKVHIYQRDTIEGISYFVVTVYFVSPDIICMDKKTSSTKSVIGSKSQVYFQIGASPNHLRPAPKYRSEASRSGWTKNSCIPGMGRHNFFEVEKYEDSDCMESVPMCIVYDENDHMHGFCVTYPGMSTASDLWEYPTPEAINVTLGVAPKCVLDQTAQNGATALHVYFTNTPWKFNC